MASICPPVLWRERSMEKGKALFLLLSQLERNFLGKKVEKPLCMYMENNYLQTDWVNIT